MTILGFTVIEIAQLAAIGTIAFAVIRGVATKKDLKKAIQDREKDCIECKADTKERLDKGSEEFNAIDIDIKELARVQTDHGEQLAGISSTVNAVANDVSMLVKHHIQ
jgi:hypothetical protein